MVVGAFPAAKLGALILKQISKPIANVLKSQAKSSPVFRKYVCLPPAQFYNWCEVKSKMWILNLGKPVNIPVLNEAMAIELGANLLGEGIIFLIAAGILISEYNRSSKKEAAKEEAKQQEMTELKNTIRELFLQSEEQAAHIRELTRRLGDTESKISNKQLPPKSPSANLPISDPNIVISQIEQPPIHQNSKMSQNLSKSSGLILRAIDDINNQFWSSPLIEREDSTLLISLYYVERLLRFR
ncbi:putative OPA3-like protein CG13603 [Leptinotarsa decemlineata]|uniref:putative OPA3-like protein CG13603 n=1 Tax=Leptinotarsa decemlineata TaxID=7539 RepID=UPI003D30A039